MPKINLMPSNGHLSFAAKLTQIVNDESAIVAKNNSAGHTTLSAVNECPEGQAARFVGEVSVIGNLTINDQDLATMVRLMQSQITMLLSSATSFQGQTDYLLAQVTNLQGKVLRLQQAVETLELALAVPEISRIRSK